MKNEKMKQKQTIKKQNIMKKYMIVAAAAALCLASCAKFDTYTVSENDGNVAIGFTNYTPRSLTKADGTFVDNTTTATLVVNKKFGVYAYATANGTAWASDAIGTQFMNDVAVTFTDNDDNGVNNSYSPTRYWPSGDTPDWLTFWAYYPVQANNGITYTAPSGNNGVGSYAFEAATDAAHMVDFMVSDVVNDKIYGASAGNPANAHIAVAGEVPLVFRHQLTKIAIKFKSNISDANTDVVLTGASLKNIKNSGILSTTYDATAQTPFTTSWAANAVADTDDDNIGDVVYDVTISGNAINNNVLNSTAVGGAAADIFLMVPQTMLANDAAYAQYIEVSWEVKTYAENADHSTANPLSTTTNTKKLYFDDCTLFSTAATPVAQADNDWVKNQFTTYTITVGPNPILFTATVEAWDAETTGAFSAN